MHDCKPLLPDSATHTSALANYLRYAVIIVTKQRHTSCARSPTLCAGSNTIWKPVDIFVPSTLPHRFPRMTFDWTDGPLAEGLRFYRAGKFFDAHEAWESVWLTAPQPEKTFLQGLIQVTVAFHHLYRDNPLGTQRLLHSALRKLESYPADFGGIDVTILCNDIRERLHSLESHPPAEHLTPVRIISLWL